VFFYGLLMDADALRAKGLRSIDPRRSCVHGFALPRPVALLAGYVDGIA
jgi:hypothetical protein